jgi:hypothetical protein
VLTYVGKETAFSAIKRVADAGVKMRAFGSKVSHVPDYIRKHPNIELLGRVSDEELVELYSERPLHPVPLHTRALRLRAG